MTVPYCSFLNCHAECFITVQDIQRNREELMRELEEGDDELPMDFDAGKILSIDSKVSISPIKSLSSAPFAHVFLSKLKFC